MLKEEYVKLLISNSGHNVKSFAASIDLPYTTLLGMLKRGIDGASVQNVNRVCKGLLITVEDLYHVQEKINAPIPFYVTDQEKKLLSNFRNNPNLQHAVNVLLGININ